MQVYAQREKSMECGFTVNEYLNHLQQALQATRQVLVVDIRKGANKAYIYTAQEGINIANAVNGEPEHQNTSTLIGEISASIQGSNNSMVINKIIDVAKTVQSSPTNGNKDHAEIQVQNRTASKTENTAPCHLAGSNTNGELIFEFISNFIMGVADNFSDLEKMNDQLGPASCEVEQIQLIPKCILGNKISEPHNILYSQRYDKRSPSYSKSRSPRRMSRSPTYKRSRSPRKIYRSPSYRNSRSPRRRSRSTTYKRSRSPRKRSRSPSYRRLRSPRKRSRSPAYKISRSPRKRSRSTSYRSSRSPRKRSRSPSYRRSVSPRRRSRSPSYRRSRRPRRRSKSPSCRGSRSTRRRSRSTSYRSSRSPRKISRSPCRRSISTRRRSMSPSCSRSRSARRRFAEELVKQSEERRVIYIGCIGKGTTKTHLTERFSKFGIITDISMHFRDDRDKRDNYGFITFTHFDEAHKAIEHGNDDTSLPHYDLSFAGRRAFCKIQYSDLDGQHEDDDGWGALRGGCSGASVPSGSVASMNFDALLKASVKNKQNEKLTIDSRIVPDYIFNK